MRCKAFDVRLELEVQAVTCPGVWLCPSGKVTVQIYLLGLCTQTSTLEPVFPILYNEKFSFRKNFANVQNLHDLDHKLNREVVYMELIQWENCDNGNVLATFKTNLMELLYPFPKRKGLLAGVDVDLLMEATSKFPGIIAPKIEISTKISINEVICKLKPEKQSDVVVINPKLINNKCVPKRNIPMRQKRVCHTPKSHKIRNKPKSATEFTFSPSVSPRDHSPRRICEHHRDKNHSNRSKIKPLSQKEDYMKEKIYNLRKSSSLDLPRSCHQGKGVKCPLCAKYRCYFPNTSCACPDEGTEGSTLNDIVQIRDEQDSIKKEGCVSEEHDTLSQAETFNTFLPKARLEQIQERLRKTYSPLNSPTHLSMRGDNLSDDETNDNKFYKNLEQFYKHLYMQAHYKLKNEKGKSHK